MAVNLYMEKSCFLFFLFFMFYHYQFYCSCPRDGPYTIELLFIL